MAEVFEVYHPKLKFKRLIIERQWEAMKEAGYVKEVPASASKEEKKKSAEK